MYDAAPLYQLKLENCDSDGVFLTDCNTSAFLCLNVEVGGFKPSSEGPGVEGG